MVIVGRRFVVVLPEREIDLGVLADGDDAVRLPSGEWTVRRKTMINPNPLADEKFD
jgi:hypothetical protein